MAPFHRISTLVLTLLLFFSSSTLPNFGFGLVLEGGGFLSAQKRIGSSPPTCRSKCGRCSPCTPVHVAIQPGVSMPLEYYPEAWRCKCGNKLYMP